MKNQTLERLKKVAASDEYDLATGKMIKKLEEQWELAVAAENLAEHLVIKEFIKELTGMVEEIDKILSEQEVMTEDEIKYRFKLQADKRAYTMVIDLFNGNKLKGVENQIDILDAKARALGD